LEFALEPVAQLTAGDELALATCQRRGVHHEVHGERGLIDAQHGKRLGGGRIHDGAAYADVLDAVDQHNVAGLGLVHQLTIQAAKLLHLIDAALERLAFWAKLHENVLPGTHPAAIDPANADLADVA